MKPGKLVQIFVFLKKKKKKLKQKYLDLRQDRLGQASSPAPESGS